MTVIKEKIMSLNLSNTYSSVKIADVSYSLVLGNGIVHATPSLTLTDVLFVPKFPVSLLSISQFTKHNNCKITFFPSHCLSGPVNWEEDWFGRERGSMYYLDDRVTPTGLVAYQSDLVLFWH